MRSLHAYAVSLCLTTAAAAPAPAVAQGDPEYLAQSGLGLARVDAAYRLGYTGAGVVVGVLDSGLAGRHPEFAGRYAGGFDLSAGRAAPTLADARDTDGHGSHVAGIIAAGRNGYGMHGVAYDARIYAVWADDEDEEGGIDLALAQGWRRMIEAGVPIVNNSIGLNGCEPGDAPPCNVGDYTPGQAAKLYPQMIEAMRETAQAGTLMVFATGNENQPHPDLLGGMPSLFPELRDNWMAVTAVDPDGRITGYANICGVAKDWCLAAPGGGDDQDKDGIDSVRAKGGYIRYSGTSMASPHVAGAAALVKQAFPYFGAYQLQQTLLTTATDIGPAGIDAVYGWGLLDTGKAVLGPAQFVADFDVDTQGYDSVFANDISGKGGLIKRGMGVLGLTGDSTYTGATQVRGGMLVVDGSVASPVAVAQQGVLGGSGRVGALDNAGTVAPGNSVGTLTVDGDYVSREGSLYLAEVDAAGSDRLEVGGQAVLQGGRLVLTGTRLRLGMRADVLQADGGIVGRYDEVDTDRIFLASAASYDPAGTLSLRVVRSDARFADYLDSLNQRAVGTALDAGSAAPPAAMDELYHDLLNAHPAALGGMADQLSGEMHASAPAALLESGSMLRGMLGARARASLGAGMAPGEPLAQAAGALPQGAAPRSTAAPLWAEAGGSRISLGGDGNTARTRLTQGGLFIGGDGPVGGGWRLGGAVGASDGSLAVDERRSRADVASYTAALYAGKRIARHAGAINVSLGAAYTRHDIGSRRSVTVGGPQTLEADYHADAGQVFAEMGYAMAAGANTTIEPYAGAAWSHLRSGSLRESGGAAALQADAQSESLGFFTLGLRASQAWSVRGSALRVSLGLGWRHAAGDVAATRTLAFAQAPAASFETAGAPLARNALLVDVGAQAQLTRNAALGLRYGGQFGDGNHAGAGSVYLRVRF